MDVNEMPLEMWRRKPKSTSIGIVNNGKGLGNLAYTIAIEIAELRWPGIGERGPISFGLIGGTWI